MLNACALAEAFGDQPARVVQAAQACDHQLEASPTRTTAHAAVTFGTDRNIEREAVVDERAVRRDALARAMGDRTVREIKAEVDARIEAGELLVARQPPGSASRTFTTREMVALERETMERMRAGQGVLASLVTRDTAHAIEHERPPALSTSQWAAVQQILASHDQILALEGVAGAGKTTTLATVRDAAGRDGYIVKGFAPTSRAAQQLAHAGIESSTLQRHLARRRERDDFQTHELDGFEKHLYILDESSLASTRQMHAFLHRLGRADRVVLVGDIRQHQAVEAGRPYQQLQETGLAIVRLDDIVRQQDPALNAVVAHLTRGQVRDAMQQLDAQGHVHEIPDRDARLRTIADAYARHPEGTLVVSPDHVSRRELNRRIHEGMQSVHPRENLLTVRRLNTLRRLYGEAVTYDPRRLQGVTVYRDADRAFARGDRVQVTAPDRERHVANRELGTVEHIERGHLDLRFDAGGTLDFPFDGAVHLEYGYAVTSHSSQGQTADRVLVHVDTGQGETMVNRRFAYVAISRGRYDAQLYTDRTARLAGTLGRELAHRSALEPSPAPDAPAHSLRRAGGPSQMLGQTGDRVP